MIKRIISAILCMLILSFSLCGCSSESVPVSIMPKQPELMLTGEYPYQLPGFMNASWGNYAEELITPVIAPLVSALELANAEETTAYLSYELNETDSGGYTLDVYIHSADSEGKIKVTSIDITKDGSVALPEYSISQYMTDGDWLNGCLRLSRYGIDPEMPYAGSMLTTADICRLFVDYYEACTGLEVDISRVRIQSDDIYLKKSLALGLCSNQYIYENRDVGVYITEQGEMFASLMTCLFTDWLGRSNMRVSQDDLTDAVSLFFRLYFDSPINDTPYLPDISGSDLPIPETPEEISRHEIALIFNAIFENCFGTPKAPEEPFFYDFSTEALEIAYNMSFIDCFPSYALSSFDYHPCEYQLFPLAEYFVNTCYWDQWSSAQNEKIIDRRSIVSMLGWADSFLDSYVPPASAAVVVDNSRNYQWYFAQFNTGEYSDMNCMPTLAAMGVKWYHADSSVTPAALRELWLPEFDSGWYMKQVADSLEHYEVPFEWHDISESITEQLDQGKIILTQMSEAAFDASGHCFVIYGYRQLGDSVQYFVNDPGVYDGLDSLGKPPGEAMVLDGAYVEWVIERMTYSYITVG